MNFDEYMKKIQMISNILEQKKYAEDVLNSKELNIVQDFQYICLSSASNYDLVNEVIARLAQNGNKNIVEENIKNISINMWKQLFDKNDAIKDIFIKNYNIILENAGIITFREIERFIENNDTRPLIYNSLDCITKKLCTYDRASLIKSLKGKEHGVEKIKEYLECFFKKGEYDISTTYSKILIELSNIQDIEQLDILIACNKHLTEMLSRETAIDNETNKLLNWIYDNFEETQIPEEQRNEIKQNIDTAILENFDHILDKSNYDRNTVKILKQFDCTREKLDKNKNHYIQKSTKQNHDTKIYNLNVEKQYMNSNTDSYKGPDEIFENTKNQIDKQNQTSQNIMNDTNSNIDTTQIEETVENLENPEQNIQKSDSAAAVEFTEKNNNEIQDIKDETSELKQEIEIFNNETQENEINIEKTDDKKSAEEKIPETTPLAEILEAKDIIAEINSRVEAFNSQMNSTKRITESEVNHEDDGEQKLKLTTSEAEEIIRTLVNSHLYETEKIIDKVMKRNKVSEEDLDQKSTIEEIQKDEAKVDIELKNNTSLIQVNNIDEVLEQDIKNQVMPISEIETKKESNENADTKIMEESKTVSINNIQENQNTALVIKENDEAISVPENIFKRIWRKILKLFKFKITVEK